jgi:hypothetical protein
VDANGVPGEQYNDFTKDCCTKQYNDSWSPIDDIKYPGPNHQVSLLRFFVLINLYEKMRSALVASAQLTKAPGGLAAPVMVLGITAGNNVKYV